MIATNAWAAGIRELGQTIAIISSDMVVTAPVPDRLRDIGCEGVGNLGKWFFQASA